MNKPQGGFTPEEIGRQDASRQQHRAEQQRRAEERRLRGNPRTASRVRAFRTSARDARWDDES